jgi:hypothetical protein
MGDSPNIVEAFIRFRRNLFSEQLPSNSSGIVHVFAEPLLRSGCRILAYCIATAVPTTIYIL